MCSFSNRFGGDILCGVLDDGQIQGVPEKAVPSMLRNFANVTTNPDLFSPILFITPQAVRIDGKLLVHIHVPISPDVHSFKDRIYDRVYEADIVVKGNSKVSEMIIRKQNIFTEQKIFPYATVGELKPGLIESCRQKAVNLQANHPWKNMTDEQLIRSAGLVK
ncbi:MAG: putative DNA binding domain-containing protein [Treponema sp.]|nr:putative DNA binding domain-containing protein [Treponema sp.]